MILALLTKHSSHFVDETEIYTTLIVDCVCLENLMRLDRQIACLYLHKITKLVTSPRHSFFKEFLWFVVEDDGRRCIY